MRPTATNGRRRRPGLEEGIRRVQFMMEEEGVAEGPNMEEENNMEQQNLTEEEEQRIMERQHHMEAQDTIEQPYRPEEEEQNLVQQYRTEIDYNYLHYDPRRHHSAIGPRTSQRESNRQRRAPARRKSKYSSRIDRIVEIDDQENAGPRRRSSSRDNRLPRKTTRKDLIKIRRKIYNLPTPPPIVRPPVEKKKKKPGRKPETPVGRGLKRNDFITKYPPSDIESDHEGYLSESEDLAEEIPTLKRTHSSDSIFLTMNYKDYRINRVSHLHKCRIHTPKHPMAKIKRRKMNRILQKHALRYKQIDLENLYFKEMLECYHGTMPRLAKEIALTKNCIRNPHRFQQTHIPEVFHYGEAGLIDICSNILKRAVAEVVAYEHASIRATNKVSRAIEEARVCRRRRIEMLNTKRRHRLPAYNYMAMEYFFLRQIDTRSLMESCIENLKNFSQKITYFAVCQPRYKLMFHYRLLHMNRLNNEFEEFLFDQQKRRRHLDRTLKTVFFENRSAQLEAIKDHERRLARRAHAEKVAALKKMSPAARERAIAREKANKAALDKQKAEMKAMKKKQKELLAKVVAARLRAEAKQQKVYDAEEALMRIKHERRIRAERWMAYDEKKELYYEYRDLEEERQARLTKRENERRAAACKEDQRKVLAALHLAYAEARKKAKEDEKKKKEAERKKKEEEERKRKEAEQKKKEEEERKRIEEQRKKELAEKKKQEEEEFRRKLREELIRKRIEEKLKLKMMRYQEEELEQKKREEMRPLTQNNRAKKLVADLGLLWKIRQENKKDVTLDMIFNDERNYFESASNAFLVEDFDKILATTIPEFVAAYKVLSDWDALLNHFVVSSDRPTRNRIPQNYAKIVENIKNGFVYTKRDCSRKRWIFEKTTASLLSDVDADLRMTFENKIVELCAPLTLNPNLQAVQGTMSPALLHSYLLNSIYQKNREKSHERIDLPKTATLRVGPNRRGTGREWNVREMFEGDNSATSVFWEPIDLPYRTSSPFWKMVDIYMRREAEENQAEADDNELCSFILRNEDLPRQCVQWVYPVLGACYTFLFDMEELPEEDYILDILEDSLVHTEETIECLDDISQHLLLIGAFFDEANCFPENLFAMIEQNGFCPVFKWIAEIAQKMVDLYIAFKLPKIARPDASFADRLLVVFDQVEKVCELDMTKKRRIQPSDFLKMREDFDATILHIFENKLYDPTQNLSDIERNERVGTVINWAQTVKIRFKKNIQKFVEKEADEAIKNQERNNIAPIEDNPPTIRRTQENEDGNESDYSVTQLGLKRRKHDRSSSKRPRIEVPRDTNFPTRLPSFRFQILQKVLRTVEVSWHDMCLIDRETLKTHLYEKFNRFHLKNSVYRFHLMVEKSAEEMKEVSDPMTGKDEFNWSSYKRVSIALDEEDARKAEDSCLKLFDHKVYSDREFRKLEWEVPRKDGQPITPIEFYTNIIKYRSRKTICDNFFNDSVPFIYRVYHHIWFMGALAPRCYAADSHENMEGYFCAGCTRGDVIIVKNCTCEKHSDADRGNFCYARTKLPATSAEYPVKRLLGRFVCEHGPSSCLVLDFTEVGEDIEMVDARRSYRREGRDREWKPFTTRFTTFNSYLKVDDIAETHKDLLKIKCYRPGYPNYTVSQDDDYVWDQRRAESIERKSRGRVKDSDRKVLRRTRSEETTVREGPDTIRCFNRVLSCMDLTEINKYAEKKWEFARRKFAPEITNRKMAKSIDQDKVLNAEALFNGSCDKSNSQNYNVIAGIFECGFNENPKEDESDCKSYFSMISKRHENFGLLHIAGEPIESIIPQQKGRMPVVGELHHRFFQLKTNQISQAKSQWQAVKLLAKEPHYEQFETLIECYSEIFWFNVYLYELYLDTMESHIFNCYAIYEAERKQDISFLQKRINSFEDSIPSVFNAFFNQFPVIRQLEDLCQIRFKHTKEELECHVASLCRYAINRIRVPAIADRKLNTAGWVNFSAEHEDTLTLSELSINDTIPPKFDENDYLEQLRTRGFNKDEFKKKMNSFYESNVQIAMTVVLSMLWQNDELFEIVRRLLPNRIVDPVMRVFYGHQRFENLRNVLYKRSHLLTMDSCKQIGTVNTSLVIAGIVERCGQRNKTALRSFLDEFFVDMSKYNAGPLPSYPSTLGVSFACFEHKLMMSVVKEAEIIVNDECITTICDKLSKHEEMKLVVVDKTWFYIIVDKRDGELDLCFLNSKTNYKDDRIMVKNFMEDKYFKPKIQWNSIIKKYILKNLNGLNETLIKHPEATKESNMVRLGRLERPQPRMGPILSTRKYHTVDLTRPRSRAGSCLPSTSSAPPQ